MRGNDANDAPSPEELAAFLDDELDAAARARVAAWLADHPRAAARLEAQRAIRRALQSATPPAPSAAAWDSVLARIDERTQVIRSRQRQHVHTARRRRFLWVGAAGAVAAALLVTLLLNRPTPAPVGPAPAAARVLPVVADDEVEILSMDAGDAGALVVGRSPLPKRFDLAATGEVTVQRVIGLDGAVGMKPNKINMDDSDGVPMLVTPLALAQPNNP